MSASTTRMAKISMGTSMHWSPISEFQVRDSLALNNLANEPDDQADKNYGSYQPVSKHSSLLELRPRFRKSDEPLCTKARGESVTFGTQIEPRTATGVSF